MSRDVTRSELFVRELPLAALTAGLVEVPHDLAVTDVTLDSREVRPGSLFLACRGRAHHGLTFAQQAVAAGARAILYEPDPSAAPPPARGLDPGHALFVAEVPGLSSHIGTIADRFFGAPSQLLTVAAVTGTNGKTTCAYLLAQSLTLIGRAAGYIGTLGCGLPDAIAPFGLTTADAVTVHRQLARLRALGAECVCMEVSSHALEQGRVDAVRFHAAAFTNLTRDHLDFHGSMEAYAAAKARLFEWQGLAARIINIDDPFGLALARRFDASGARLLVTTRGAQAQSHRAALPHAELVAARRVAIEPAGSRIEIDSSAGQASLRLPLIGGFNVDNALTVLAALLALEVPLARAVDALARCRAAPGRMEVVGSPDGAVIAIVDYAHTPDALEQALTAARAHCRGALRVVFGCGGDRDAGKRPLMGRVARALADEVILTDDNPRSEDPERITADILGGIEDARGVSIEHDRAAAIRGALERSVSGDVVLIAGKGHEQQQLYASDARAFSDRAVAQEFFSRSRGRP